MKNNLLIGLDANEANLTSRRVGINQYAFGLLHALYHLKTNRRFIIYLKTPPQPDLPQETDNWRYRVIPAPLFWTQTRLPWDLFVRSPRPDVFFSLSHYAPRWSPVPTVVAVMDLGFLSFSQQFTVKDYNQLKSWTDYSVRRAKKIVAISEFTKQDIVKHYDRNPEDIVVTYPGYDQRLFKPTKNLQVLKKYGIREPYFLFLSSLKPSKNVEGLIRAFYLLSTKHLALSTYRLVIAGKKAWLYDQIFSLVKQLKLENRIIFTGFVEEAEVPILMSHAAAFVMPSFYEGFGIPVLEAMACSTPIVVSRVSSLPEVAGPAGIYVNPASPDSITSGLLTAVGPRRQEFVTAGLKRVKLFSWEVCARQTLKCLETAWAGS